jgi:hypothetical protein
VDRDFRDSSQFLGSGLENVPHQYNFVVAMADDRRVTRGGPAAVLERSMLGDKTQLDPCLAAKMDPAALDWGASRGGRGWGI